MGEVGFNDAPKCFAGVLGNATCTVSHSAFATTQCIRDGTFAMTSLPKQQQAQRRHGNTQWRNHLTASTLYYLQKHKQFMLPVFSLSRMTYDIVPSEHIPGCPVLMWEPQWNRHKDELGKFNPLKNTRGLLAIPNLSWLRKNPCLEAWESK